MSAMPDTIIFYYEHGDRSHRPSTSFGGENEGEENEKKPRQVKERMLRMQAAESQGERR
jgi:hypothetical protein